MDLQSLQKRKNGHLQGIHGTKSLYSSFRIKFSTVEDRCGKTYAILEFGRQHYDNVAYFNFQTNESLAATFDENISPSYLLPILAHISGQTITRGNTLIVFDEIQLCERAVTSLKYFCEEAPEYHVIAAGSRCAIH